MRLQANRPAKVAPIKSSRPRFDAAPGQDRPTSSELQIRLLSRWMLVALFLVVVCGIGLAGALSVPLCKG